MASARQGKFDFLSQKLTFLKVKGDQLISDVREYVYEIIEAGESWREGGDTHMGYMELCQMIDSAVVYLCEKGEELSANHSLRPSCEVSADTSLPPTAKTSTTSHRQPAAPLTSTASTSLRQSSVSVPPTYEIQQTSVLPRISVMEEALCSFQGNAKKAAEQQSGLDQQLKEILLKLTESDKKNNSRFRKIKEQVKEQISEINENISLGSEHETRLQSLEKQLQKLSMKQERVKVEMTYQTELSEKLVHVPDQLETVKGNLNVLEARIDRIIDDCSNKDQKKENVMRDLADKVVANTDTGKAISEHQDKTHDLLGELETRFQTLEAESERNVTDVRELETRFHSLEAESERNVTDVRELETRFQTLEANSDKEETNFQILCQMLNDRLSPLEQLRTCLNERAIGRDENIRKLSQINREVAVMSPRLQQLELKSSRTRCGFTARTRLSGEVAGDTLKQYPTTLSNVGGNFNADSGIFTAPVDGLYVASASLEHWGNGYVEVSVRYKEQGQGQSYSVCWISSTVNETTACNMGVVDMKAGDTLSIFVDRREMSYTDDVWFSSFLLA